MGALVRENVAVLQAYVPGEQPRIPGLIKLNTNENPYAPSPRVAEAWRSFCSDDLRKYPDPMSLDLRRRVAEIHGCGEEQVFAGNGSDEILALCTRAFVEDDGTIGYFSPSYSLYPVLAAIRNVGTWSVELPEGFGWTIPAGRECALFFLTNPNAPTGIQYPREAVLEFCRGFRGVVLIDEAYVDFARDDCMPLARSLPNVLVMRTLSKSYSLAGLRVGYAVGAAALVEALYRIKDSYNLDMVAQRLALAALSDVDAMRANVARIVATRARLARRLDELGFVGSPSATNFLWTMPPAPWTAVDLLRRLRAEAILVRHFQGPRTGAYLRITVGTDAEIDRLLQVVERLVSPGGIEVPRGRTGSG